MQVEIFTLCREARDSGRALDVLGAFDTFRVPKVPVHVPACTIAGRIRFERIEEGTHQVRLLFMDADGRPVVPEVMSELTVTVPEGASTVYKAFALHLDDFTLERTGEYAVKLAVDRVLLASIPAFCELSR